MVDIRLVDDEPVRRAWAPRILAPLAFFTAATVLVLLVQSAMNSGSGEAAEPPGAAPAQTAPAATGPTTETQGEQQQQRRFYRIRSGDTLEQIAERFDTTVDDLLQLNPGIDAQALTPGRRIRVR